MYESPSVTGDDKDDGELYKMMLYYKETETDVYKSVSTCKEIYSTEKEEENFGDAERTDAFFFARLGTNDVADFFYANVEESLPVKVKQFVRYSRQDMRLEESNYSHIM